MTALSPAARDGRDGAHRQPCAVIYLKCSTATPKWELYLTSIGPATVFQDIVVFSVTGGLLTSVPLVPPAAGCMLMFGAGWYGVEQSGRDWWRWSDGRGEIQVVTAQESTIILRGQIISLQHPNQADLFINDERVMTVDITKPDITSFETGPLPLRAGENRLVFASSSPAIRIPTDSRALALAVRNLLLTRANDGAVCALQP